MTLGDLNKEQRKMYGSESNTFEDFPVGTHVKIICACQDFHFFYGETGKVIKNEGKYLSIIVEYDEPRHYEDGTIEKTFNFNPNDLVLYNNSVEVIEKEHKRLCQLTEEERVKEEENLRRSERFMIMEL